MIIIFLFVVESTTLLNSNFDLEFYALTSQVTNQSDESFLENKSNSNQTERSKKYQGIRYILFFVDFIWSTLIFTLFLFTGFSKKLMVWAKRVTNKTIFANGIYILIFILIFSFLSFPTNFYGGFILEHQFSLSNQNFISWFFDFIKGILVGIVIMVPAGVGTYALLSRFKKRWWVYASIVWIFFTIVIVQLSPILIAPLFNKFTPIQDLELKKNILLLGEKAGMNIKDVFRVDMSRQTKKANAYFTGLGRTKRIALGDNLLDKYTHGEIEVVLAHEIGHWKLNHIWKFIGFFSILTFLFFWIANFVLKKGAISFGFSDISDISGLPLLLLVFTFGSFILTPIQSAFSRFQEHQADVFALELTGNTSGFISTMEKLGRQNLADIDPNPVIEFILFDHPSIKKRIEFAREHEKSKFKRED